MDTKAEIKKYTDDVKDLPLWLKYALAVFAILGTFGTLFGVYVTLRYPAPIPIITDNSTTGNATTTINLSDMFAKANDLDSVLERQDFLEKYIGSKIYGKGSVAEVSRSGDGYIVDVKIAGHLVSCQLNGGEENERRVPLLKGKTVSLTGTFTFTNIFGHGLDIDDCIF